MKPGRSIVIGLAAIVICGVAGLLHFRNSRTTTAVPMPKPVTHKSPFHHYSQASGWETKEGMAETDQLTKEEINSYLDQNGRNPMSLLAAYSLLKDTNFLNEAAQKYPKDPRVELCVLEANLSLGERAQWLDAFKQNAPENPLPNYLMAIDLVGAGDTQRAIAEAKQAVAKVTLDIYWPDLANAVANAYTSAGFSAEDADLMANSLVALSPIAEKLHDLANFLATEAAYQQDHANPAEADALFRLGLEIGNQLTSGSTGKLLHNEVAGIDIQSQLLYNSLVPTITGRDGTTQSADDRAQALQQRKSYLDNLMETVPLDELILSQALSDGDLREVTRRVRTDGEVAAMEWVRDKLGPNLPSHPSASERK
jgi:hypothetical protein